MRSTNSYSPHRSATMKRKPRGYNDGDWFVFDPYSDPPLDQQASPAVAAPASDKRSDGEPQTEQVAHDLPLSSAGEVTATGEPGPRRKYRIDSPKIVVGEDSFLPAAHSPVHIQLPDGTSMSATTAEAAENPSPASTDDTSELPSDPPGEEEPAADIVLTPLEEAKSEAEPSPTDPLDADTTTPQLSVFSCDPKPNTEPAPNSHEEDQPSTLAIRPAKSKVRARKVKRKPAPPLQTNKVRRRVDRGSRVETHVQSLNVSTSEPISVETERHSDVAIEQSASQIELGTGEALSQAKTRAQIENLADKLAKQHSDRSPHSLLFVTAAGCPKIDDYLQLLGIHLANDQRTLLIGNTRSTSLDEASLGLTDLAHGNVSVPGPLATEVSDLEFLPYGTGNLSAGQDQAERLRACLARWKESHQHILIASSNMRDARVLAAHCDATYLAIGLQSTSQSAATELTAQLQQAGARMLGCIVMGSPDLGEERPAA